jgi:hypothetical protein
MPKVMIKMEGWLCAHCDHKWVPRYYYTVSREMVPPKVCPRCKSTAWNDESKRRRRPAQAEE